VKPLGNGPTWRSYSCCAIVAEGALEPDLLGPRPVPGREPVGPRGVGLEEPAQYRPGVREEALQVLVPVEALVEEPL
jgi:hypothetical protein